MNNRRTKIMVDIFMMVFLILSFVRWDGTGGFIYHAVVGSACALFFGVHVFIHRKWIVSVSKSFFGEKLNRKLREKYVVNMLLLLVWGVSIVTGFLAIAPFFDDVGGAGMGRLHGITARIGLVLIVVHVVQHLPQIKSYLGLGKRGKKNRSDD
ncbi:MAG: hypothetical protein FWC71_11290 [Defluviitaleaceae bacterium]|nr:hypothetical protein [Defluviitaleaceae bacterium]